MKAKNPARRAAMGGILAALSVACLLAAAYLPAGKLGFYFVAAFLPIISIAEGDRPTAALSSLAASLVALFILPNKVAVLPYVCFLAWYAILRDLFSKLSRVAGKLLLLLCFDAGVFVWGLILSTVFGIFPSQLFSFDMTPLLWALAAVASQAAFFAFDFLFGLCVEYYSKKLLPRMRRS